MWEVKCELLMIEIDGRMEQKREKEEGESKMEQAVGWRGGARAFVAGSQDGDGPDEINSVREGMDQWEALFVVKN